MEEVKRTEEVNHLLVDLGQDGVGVVVDDVELTTGRHLTVGLPGFLWGTHAGGVTQMAGDPPSLVNY